MLHDLHFGIPNDHGRVVSPLRCSIVQGLDILFPHCLVHPNHFAIICHHSIDLALHICRLRPYTARASEQVDLLTQLNKQIVAAVIPVESTIGELVGSLTTKIFVPRVLEVVFWKLGADAAEFAL